MSSDSSLPKLYSLTSSEYDQLNFQPEKDFLFEHLGDWVEQESQDEDFDSFDLGLLGGGTGVLASDIAKEWPEVQVMSCDESIEYLEEARFHVEVAGVTQQVQLHHLPPGDFGIAEDQFHGVASLFYLPEKEDLVFQLSSILRTLKTGGRSCIMDFCRPEGFEECGPGAKMASHPEVVSLVERLDKQNGIEAGRVEKWVVSRLMGSPSFDQVRQTVAQLGADPSKVSRLNSLQWAWVEDSVS